MTYHIAINAIKLKKKKKSEVNMTKRATLIGAWEMPL